MLYLNFIWCLHVHSKQSQGDSRLPGFNMSLRRRNPRVQLRHLRVQILVLARSEWDTRAMQWTSAVRCRGPVTDDKISGACDVQRCSCSKAMNNIPALLNHLDANREATKIAQAPLKLINLETSC